MSDRRRIRLALRNQLLTVSGLPAARAWTNVEHTPVQGQAFIAESFSQDTAHLRTLTAGGVIEATGMYAIQWYGVADTASQSIDDGVAAILAAFPPGLALPLSDGTSVRVRGGIAPFAGEILPTGDGWAVCTVKVFWRREALLPAA